MIISVATRYQTDAAIWGSMSRVFNLVCVPSPSGAWTRSVDYGAYVLALEHGPFRRFLEECMLHALSLLSASRGCHLETNRDAGYVGWRSDSIGWLPSGHILIKVMVKLAKQLKS